jgi:hypothetical protein
MKYIITESQLSKLISEQEPEGRYGLERYGYNYTKPETLQPAQAKQQQAIKDLSSLDLDTTIDFISGIIDTIPVVGNLTSAGIDVTHGLSYLVRLIYEKVDTKKVEYMVLAAATLAGALIPVAGNTVPALAKKVVNSVLKKASEIIKLVQTLHINHPWWIIAVIMSLIKVIGEGKIVDLINTVVGTLYKISAKMTNQGLKKSIESGIGFIKSLNINLNPQTMSQITNFAKKNII